MRGLECNTLVEAFAAFAPGDRDRPFLTFWQPASAPAERVLTFGDFLTLSARFAARFSAGGAKSGDRVVLVMPPGPDVMAAFAGAMFLGAVPAILAYPNFKIDPAKYAHGLHGVIANLSARLVVLQQDFPADLRSSVESAAAGASIVSSALGDESPLDVNRLPPPAPSSLAFIQHSAGTTGLQKGVALSHRAVLTQLRHLYDALRCQPDDRLISWLPLYHDMGLIACFMLPLAAHLPIVMQSPVDWVLAPVSMLELASRHRCTLGWLPNFAFQHLARRTPADVRAQLDLSSLRALVNCSEPVRAESVDEFQQAFGTCGFRGEAAQASYAMAENTFAVTQTAIGVAPSRLTIDRDGRRRTVVSSGQCLPGNQIRVVDEQEKDLGDLEAGELFVRSDSMLDGYFNRPDLTSRALVDGWYRTSDLGFTAGGEVYVLGRKDDTIIIAGRNIWPADVEEIAGRHAAVRDGRVVAFGVLNESLGTQDLVVVAEAAVATDSDDAFRIENEIRALITRELDLSPRLVQIAPQQWIVKSSAGKPARSATRDKFLAEFSGRETP
jgi:acyl-CoA synthetase (AMP-forming)/AMP-acid ligase II